MKSSVAFYALPLIAFIVFATITVDAQDAGINDEKVIKSFSSLLKGVSAGKAYMSDIHQLAATTSYPEQTIVIVSRQLLAWGWKPEDSITILRACAKAAESIGADDSKFTKIALLVGRLTDDKQSPYIAFSGLENLDIPAWQMIAHSTGKSVDQTKRYALGNELSTKRAYEILIAGFNDLSGGATEQEARKVKGGIPETTTAAPTPAPPAQPATAPTAKEEKKTCFFGGTMIPCSKN